jgi:hypothetical protein
MEGMTWNPGLAMAAVAGKREGVPTRIEKTNNRNMIAVA